MTWTLVRKLLRDVRVALLVVGLLLGAFQCLWARITERILGQLGPFIYALAGARGILPNEVENTIFDGPGKIVRTLMGGERIRMDQAMDLMSIGYVHPLVQFILCIWAVGRASSAIAGELDRGTLELLLAQPLARFKLILAHFWVDLLTIPVLVLSMWMGTLLGTWLIGPIKIEKPAILKIQPKQTYLVELGPLKIKVPGLEDRLTMEPPASDAEKVRRRLNIDPWAFGPSLLVIGSLVFAVSGFNHVALRSRPLSFARPWSGGPAGVVNVPGQPGGPDVGRDGTAPAADDLLLLPATAGGVGARFLHVECHPAGMEWRQPTAVAEHGRCAAWPWAHGLRPGALDLRPPRSSRATLRSRSPDLADWGEKCQNSMVDDLATWRVAWFILTHGESPVPDVTDLDLTPKDVGGIGLHGCDHGTLVETRLQHR